MPSSTAALAQLVEHRYRKPRVVGSNPMGGSIISIVNSDHQHESGQRLHS